MTKRTANIKTITIFIFTACYALLAIPSLYSVDKKFLPDFPPVKQTPVKKYDPIEKRLLGPLAGAKEIVFAVRTPGKNGHWYANFSHFGPWPEEKLYGDRGRLCRLNLLTGKLTVLLEDKEGSIRDPQLHYDAKKILFSYREGGQDFYRLYEINIDGKGLRQLTTGPYDDIEPTYLPDGGIMFASSRCNRYVNCWLSRVAVLYRCDADGSNIRALSSNNEHDNTPWPLPDGRIIYTRWEYVDRSQMKFHHLWTANPDGTGQMVYYGNLHPGMVMIDAKPIPGTNKTVAIFCPGHGRIEHTGEVRIIDPRSGPDDQASAKVISRKDGKFAFKFNYRDPYPMTENAFLVAEGGRILLMDAKGALKLIYQLSDEDIKAGLECHEPRPLVRRKREPIIAPRIDTEKITGEAILSDVTYGRKMEGVLSGEIKKLLVLETLPIPIHYHGGQHPITLGGSFSLERILGEIPVEADGSAYAELPAMRSLFFVAMDENNNSIKRMQSFLTLQPGETMSCAGCHEHRTRTTMPTQSPALQAMTRPPSVLQPIADIPEVFDFPRDIQPVLDNHCVKCHNCESHPKGVCLTGDRGPVYSHSYFSLISMNQIADGRNREFGNRAPRTIGAAASPLMKKIENGHNGVKLSQHEKNLVRYWIESAAPYAGTYAALGTGMINYSLFKGQVRLDMENPAVLEGKKAIQQRCLKCHKAPKLIPTMPSNNVSGSWRRSPHIVFNLTHPEKSSMLLAPLALESGGLGICQSKSKSPKPIFADKNDAAYKTILASIEASKGILDEIKRFDMAGFRPRQDYIREMQHYGILPRDLAEDDPVDPYATDAAYWESFWLK